VAYGYRKEIEDKTMRGLQDKVAIVAGAAPGTSAAPQPSALLRKA
jgi:hypothetical protein